jgi:hypothetical protein
VHNRQPWRWRVDGHVLELHADPDPAGRDGDPEGRLAMLTCGGALHQARLTLLAEGWSFEIERPAAEPLARIRLLEQDTTDPGAVYRYETTLVRQTDGHRVSDEPVDVPALAAVTSSVVAERARLHVLRPAQLRELAAAVERAAPDDPPAGGRHAARDPGPPAPHDTGAPVRDLGSSGRLPAGEREDTAAVYALLYGDGDDPGHWLCAGEALEAAWLTAIEHGLSLLPVSLPVELPSTRQLLRRLLSDVGYPYLALRLGTAVAEHPAPRGRQGTATAR